MSGLRICRYIHGWTLCRCLTVVKIRVEAMIVIIGQLVRARFLKRELCTSWRCGVRAKVYVGLVVSSVCQAEVCY